MKLDLILTKSGLSIRKKVGGKLAPQKWGVKYPKVVKEVNIKNRRGRDRKKENEEPVSVNSLGELAPPNTK